MKTLLLFLCFVSCHGLRPPKEKPNIIIFYADDMGYGDLSSFGMPTTETPNLDLMVQNGMKFTQFYTAAAICSASRGSLLTGRVPVRTGIYSPLDYPENLLFRVFYPWSTGSLPKSELIIPKLLKTANYSSMLVGKWHLGHVDALPTLRGFDKFYGLPYSQDEGCPTRYGETEYCDSEWAEIWPGVPLYRNTTIIQQPVNLETLTPRYNVEAMNFIEENKDNPFFLEMAYDEVHVPLFASPSFLNTTKRGLFGDALKEMDNSIGVILKKVQSLGLEKNTFVFFSSDNGPWLEQNENGGSAGMLRGGKGSTWEGGFRVPGIAYWPGQIKANIVNEEVASTMDLFVTSLQLAGVAIPQDRIIDGKSLLPLFNGGKSEHEFLFYYREHLLYAVRYGAYKAHFITQEGFGLDPPVTHDPPLLFNLNHDPAEKWPLTDSKFKPILDAINVAVAKENANMKKGKPQLDGEDPLVAPCCNDATNCFCNQL